VVALGLVAGACGDDEAADTTVPDTAAADGAATDGDAAADGASSDVAAYCDAALAIETAPEPDVDFEAPPEEMAAGIRAYATDTLQPLVGEAVALAPAEITEPVGVMAAGIDDMATTGDPVAVESPEFTAASGEVHEYELANCGWEPVDVTTRDYAFEGVPEELPAGPTSFEMTNAGAEVHEFLLVRRNDGTTEPVEELVALPEEEALALVTPVGTAGPVVAGEGDHAVVDLTPGEYIAVCVIPTGMVAFDGPPPEGAAPHAMSGMTAEFTVS
jgi:hypothetical protein